MVKAQEAEFFSAYMDDGSDSWVELSRRPHQPAVHAGLLEGRVSKEHQNA